jgi:hypothetical protein
LTAFLAEIFNRYPITGITATHHHSQSKYVTVKILWLNGTWLNYFGRVRRFTVGPSCLRIATYVMVFCAAISCGKSASTERADPVDKFWKQEEAIVASALRGGTIDDVKYMEALIFLKGRPESLFAVKGLLLGGCLINTLAKTSSALKNGTGGTRVSCVGMTA